MPSLTAYVEEMMEVIRVNSDVADTTDQRQCIRKMLAKKKKKQEYNAALQGLFVDIKGTCDLANGNVLHYVLNLVCS